MSISPLTLLSLTSFQIRKEEKRKAYDLWHNELFFTMQTFVRNLSVQTEQNLDKKHFSH